MRHESRIDPELLKKAQEAALAAGEAKAQAEQEARECQKLRVQEEKRKNKAIQRARGAEEELARHQLELSHAKQQQAAKPAAPEAAAAAAGGAGGAHRDQRHGGKEGASKECRGQIGGCK